MKKIYFVTFFSFMFLSVFVYSEEASEKPQWGIFDYVYQHPKEKPGRIEITGDENDTVYDLFVQGQTDLYTKRSGSWQLTAKTQLMNPEIKNPNYGNGLIIFEGEIAGHGHFMDYGPLVYRVYSGSDDTNHGETITLLSKSSAGDTIGSKSIYDRIAKRGDPIYLRITKYAPGHLFFSEYSLDGQNWLFFDFRYMNSKEEASFGLSCVTPHTGIPAHYRVSQVRLEPAPPFALRTFSVSMFHPNQQVRACLEIVNPGSEPVSVIIRERTPYHWTINNIHPMTVCNQNEIRWQHVLPPGETYFSYTIQPPNHPGWYADFRGSVGNIAIIGVNELKSAYTIDMYKINMVVIFLLFLIHFTMFFFNPHQLENLFFSLFAFFYLCWSICYHYFFESIPEYVWSLILLFVTALIIMLNGFFHSLLCNKVSRLFWLYVGITIAFFSYGWLAHVNFDHFNYNLIHSFFIIWISLDCIRILGLAVYRRIPGIWIAACGGIVCIYPFLMWKTDVLGILPVWIYEINMKFWSNLHILSREFHEWTTFFFLVFISIYLSFRFARMAKNLNLLNVELEDRVAKRTAELERANEELRELDKMKSQFVSQASHDLRTPLTAIKGSLDNLLLGIAGDLNEKQQKVMTRATKSVDRLTNLINDVLDLNRIETGRMVLEKSNVPIKTLVENIINENKPAADLKRIQLSTILETDATIHADAGKLERVVGELISNAIKYTPEDGNVYVTLTQTDDQITLSVKDSGIGMTKEECEKIWERFYRTNASKLFAKGSGLGLSIAKELVEMHGGTLAVKSEQGKGTTFCMILPRHW